MTAPLSLAHRPATGRATPAATGAGGRQAPPPSPAGRWAPLAQGGWLMLAGVIGALAVRDPAFALAGWLGAGMIAWGMARWRASAIASAGLVLGGMAAAWVALGWVSAGYTAAGGPGWIWAAGVPTTFVWALLPRLPLIAAWWLLGTRLPVWVWLPPAWVLGEAWLEASIGLHMDAWLYGQWQVEPVLRALALWGWVPTLGLCLLLASALGAAAAGSRRALVPAAVLVVGALALPARPVADPAALAGIGVVHMATSAQLPADVPDGLSLLVWPEQVGGQRPHIDEGPARGTRRMRMPAMRPGMHQLVGSLVLTPDRDLNAVVALAPDGRVRAVRGKRSLFPLVERPFLGLMAPNRQRLSPGRAPAHFDLGGRRVGSLVCLESFDRGLMHEARASGARLMAISANDELLGHSPIGDRQMLGVSVMRAVESHMPIARAAMNGRASLIAADGRVLAWSAPGETGVLTLNAEMQPARR